MRGVWVVVVLGLLGCVSGLTLQQIKENVEKTKTIDASTIGTKLSGKISVSIHVNKFVCTNLTATLTSDSLTITTMTDFWKDTIYTKFYFYKAQDDIELSMQFTFKSPLSIIYSMISQKSAPSFLRGLEGSDSFSVELNTGSNGIIPEGVAISGTVTITNGTLIEAARLLHPGIKSLKVAARAYVPIYTNPSYIDLKLQEMGTFPLSKTIVINDFTITVDKTTSVDIDLSMGATVEINGPNKKPDNLQFSLSADFETGQKSAMFMGKMQGKWVPFGLDWITVTSATAKLGIGGSYHLSFSLAGVATLKWSTSPVNAGISVGGTDMDDLLFYVDNIPIVDNSLAKVYEDVVGGKYPEYFDDMNAVGKASFALATYDSSHAKEGFTFDIDVTLTEDSKLLKAVQVLKKGATSTTFTYDMSLYVALFSDPSCVDFSLKETGAFKMFDGVECEDFSVNVDISSDPTIDISTELHVTMDDKQVLDFTLSADFVADEDAKFSGSLTNKWVHPFGLKWMTLDGASVSLTLGESGMSDLKLEGTASFTFDAVKQATVLVEIGGTGLQDVLFAVTNLEFDTLTLGLMWMDITGSTNIPSSFASLDPSGTASMFISTYAAPVAAEGFTLKLDVTLKDAGDIYKAASTLSKDVSQLTFDMTLIIPVFTNIADITFDLTETGKFELTKDIEVEDYHLDIAISSHTSIDIGATLSVTLEDNPAPVQFSIGADWSESTSISFTGSLVGDWDHPYHADWLDITAASVDLVVGVPASVSSFTISGSGDFTFKDDKGSASFEIHTADDFTQNAFIATVKNIWTLTDVVETVLGKIPSDYVKDLETTASDSLTIAILTYDGQYPAGLTIDVAGKVTGALANEVEKVTYWWGADVKDMAFSVALTIPVFSTDPADIDLSLTFSEQIQLSKHMWFEDVAFSIDLSPFALKIATKLKAQFNKNPVMYFDVGGALKPTEVLLYGAMMGKWVNPFHIKGFNLSDVILQIGFSPSDCAVDACISDLGMGAQMTIGHDTVKFDGNVAIPDFWDMYLAGSIEGKGDLILSVLDVVREWNKLNIDKVSTKDIPPTWGLNDVGFYFAPVDGSLGPIDYTAGFGITGGITILDMKLYLSVNCTFADETCNFAFDVDISKDTFTQMIKKELVADYPNNTTKLDIFSLNSVSLSDWSQKHVSQGMNPHWLIDITVMNKRNKLDFHVEQYELSSTFHEFFQKWLGHLFH